MHLTKTELESKISELEDEAWELLFVDCVEDFHESSSILETLKQEVDCWLQYYRQLLQELEQGE